MKNHFSHILTSGLLLIIAGCSSSNSSSNDPSAVIGRFNNAMTSAGVELQSSSLADALRNGLSAKYAVSSVDESCDENASPIENGTFMDQNNPEYPAKLFYCKIVKDSGSPESIPGSYGQIRSIACALEQAGINYDGIEHEATVNVDSNCFTEEELADDEMPSSLEITYVASEPAEFNSNFQRGVVMSIPDFGTFTLATSVVGSDIKFMGYENQGSTKTGVYVGEFNSESGEIRFEARHDRFNCTEESSCGWSKHDRIYLKCGSINDDGECLDVEEVQGASSDIFSENDYGRIATISGDFSVGVKTRLFVIDDGQFNTPGSWEENMSSDSQCYTFDSATSGDCSENNGIELPSSTFTFTLFDGFTPNSQWYQDVESLDFTSVSLSSDIP